MKIFDSTLGHVERALDLQLQRQGVLAGNLANLDTPGFRPKDIDFAAAMSSASAGLGDAGGGAVARTDTQHMDAEGQVLGLAGDAHRAAAAPVIETGGETPSLDGNQVDLDRTMAAIAQNSLQYNANARAATRKLAILRYVVNDGNG